MDAATARFFAGTEQGDAAFWQEVLAFVDAGGDVPERYWPWVRGLHWALNRLELLRSTPPEEPVVDPLDGECRCPECGRVVRVQVLTGGTCAVVQRDGRRHLCPQWSSPNAQAVHLRTLPPGPRPARPTTSARPAPPPLSVEPPTLE